LEPRKSETVAGFQGVEPGESEAVPGFPEVFYDGFEDGVPDAWTVPPA
jgi:hypothetical protein